MDPLIRAISLMPIVIAVALSHVVSQTLVQRLSREPGGKVHPLATRIGAASVFAGIFLVIWLTLSLLLVFPRVWSRAS